MSKFKLLIAIILAIAILPFVHTSAIKAEQAIPDGIYNAKESKYLSISSFKKSSKEEKKKILLDGNHFIVLDEQVYPAGGLVLMSDRELSEASVTVKVFETKYETDLGKIASQSAPEEVFEVIDIAGNVMIQEKSNVLLKHTQFRGLTV